MPSSPGSDRFALEFRSGNYFVNVERERGGTKEEALTFHSESAARCWFDKFASWVWANGGMIVPLLTAAERPIAPSDPVVAAWGAWGAWQRERWYDLGWPRRLAENIALGSALCAAQARGEARALVTAAEHTPPERPAVTCLRCGHLPCAACRGSCIYPGEPGADAVTMTNWPTSEPRSSGSTEARALHGSTVWERAARPIADINNAIAQTKLQLAADEAARARRIAAEHAKDEALDREARKPNAPIRVFADQPRRRR